MQSFAARNTANRRVGHWPAIKTAVLDWLMNETRDEPFIDNILMNMCQRLRAQGVSVARATLHFRTHNPQWLGARILWRDGIKDASINTFDYGVECTAQYRDSPVNEIYDGTSQVRQRLEGYPTATPRHPLYGELQLEGLTDYIAWPLDHTLGKRHVVTFASDHPGGFSAREITLLRDLLPALTLVTEIRLKNLLARTLLETYVGSHAAEEILAGATTRGSGTTVNAAILVCDLRDFTTISDRLPRDDVIDLLNTFFDALSEPIERHGGEILKFIGDGLLAIFPLSNRGAYSNLLTAIREAQTAIIALNEQNACSGRRQFATGSVSMSAT